MEYAEWVGEKRKREKKACARDHTCRLLLSLLRTTHYLTKVSGNDTRVDSSC